MPETSQKNLERTSKLAHDLSRQVDSVLQRLATRQAALEKQTQDFGRTMLRTLADAESRSRRATNELERLAQRTASLANQQLTASAQAPSLSSLTRAAPSTSTSPTPALPPINFNVQSPNADSFLSSERQITAMLTRLISSGTQNS